MKIGDQIVYMPSHADSIFHADVEFGFITGFSRDGTPFCRYWNNPKREVLRTTANSEATPRYRIKKYKLKPQKMINKLLKELGYE
jgi:hypothetical protein